MYRELKNRDRNGGNSNGGNGLVNSNGATRLVSNNGATVLVDELEASERAVIGRRKQELATILKITNDFLRHLQSRDVIDEQDVNTILMERSNPSRVVRLVDLLLSSKSSDAAQRFRSALAQTDYHWLARDLACDVISERGQVKPSLHMIEDAAVIVHRKFGTSKRFSETDKKELSETIATKLLVSHADYLSELDQLRQHLTSSVTAHQVKVNRAMRLTETLREFVRGHVAQLTTHAHDMETTSELIKRIISDPLSGDVLSTFKNNLEAFLRQFGTAINQREALLYEREKCGQMLGNGGKMDAGDLDIFIGRFVTSGGGRKVDGGWKEGEGKGKEDKDIMIRRLEQRLKELERGRVEFEDIAEDYRRKLEDKELEIEELRRMTKT